MSALTLSFEAPNPPLSINEANRMKHWAQKARRLKPWRECVTAAWEDSDKAIKGMPCTVQVILPFRTNQRRDPHNYTGTVVKALVDALVRAGAWPDDTPEWVNVLDPLCEVGTTEVRIVLTER